MTTETRTATVPEAGERKFVNYLERLLEDADRSLARAAMAHLGRGLGKPAGMAYEMDRYVLDQLPENTSSYQEEAYYLVASLFAFWHRGKDKAESLEGKWDTDRNLGKSLRAMIQREDPDKRENLEKSTERRLNALLNSHRDDLADRLRRIIALLKSKDVPVNWAQFLRDLQQWDTESRSVQHTWAKGFWIQKQASDSKQDTLPEEENE